MNNNLAPIVLFVYNRPEHTRRTVEALRANRLAAQSRLFVFSDGPKSEQARPAVEEVRRYIDAIDGFASVEVVKQEHNLGLANSVIAGVTQVVNEFGRVIVLEDDLVTSPFFLDYMNDGLELYKDDDEVGAIQGYRSPIDVTPSAPSFFLPYVDCWGWGTWARAWRYLDTDARKLSKELKAQGLAYQFDMNGSHGNMRLLKLQAQGKVSSWFICWNASNFLMGKKMLYPAKTFINCIGLDGSGTHGDCIANDDKDFFNAELCTQYKPLSRVAIQTDEEVLAAFVRLGFKVYPSLIVRAFRKLKRISLKALNLIKGQ